LHEVEKILGRPGIALLRQVFKLFLQSQFQLCIRFVEALILHQVGILFRIVKYRCARLDTWDHKQLKDEPRWQDGANCNVVLVVDIVVEGAVVVKFESAKALIQSLFSGITCAFSLADLD
jgi:hypothetical protein